MSRESRFEQLVDMIDQENDANNNASSTPSLPANRLRRMHQEAGKALRFDIRKDETGFHVVDLQTFVRRGTYSDLELARKVARQLNSAEERK